jgi:hypothetical protein
MKALAILVVSIAVLLPIHGQEKTSKTTANKGIPSNPHQPQFPPTTTIWNVVDQETTERQSDSPEKHPKNYLSRLFSPENLPNIGLFIVGFIGIGSAISTLKKIERQTAATEKSLILQFRPKVIIRGGHVVDADRLEEATMEFAITNIGASAATVLETELVAKLVNHPTPTFSFFEQSFPISLLKLGPGMGHLHTVTLDKETTAAIQQMDFDHRNKSGEGKKTILFAGTLQYRDELGILRRTGIFREYSAAKRRFVSLSDPDYEYAD